MFTYPFLFLKLILQKKKSWIRALMQTNLHQTWKDEAEFPVNLTMMYLTFQAVTG